ncbi:MAG: AAA family ATPase [Nanoarchaeota archaeon]
MLKNIGVHHKKLLICFSGIPGSGKTHIAKIIEKKYFGVRIRSDDIRNIIKKLKNKEKNVNKITYKYLDWLFKNYSFKNKLIILDKSIDRKYKETFSIFRKKRYKIFIIRIKTSKKISKERVSKLGKLNENYINNIERWLYEWKGFEENVKSDIIIKNENNLNLKPLFFKLDKLIR